VGGHAHSLIL